MRLQGSVFQNSLGQAKVNVLPESSKARMGVPSILRLMVGAQGRKACVWTVDPVSQDLLGHGVPCRSGLVGMGLSCGMAYPGQPLCSRAWTMVFGGFTAWTSGEILPFATANGQSGQCTVLGLDHFFGVVCSPQVVVT